MFREITANDVLKNNIVCSAFLAASKTPSFPPESILRSHRENNVINKIIAIWNWVSKFIYYFICALFFYMPEDSVSSIKQVPKKKIPVDFKYNHPFCHVSIEALKEEKRINNQLSFFEKIQKGVLSTPVGSFYELIKSKSSENSLENVAMTSAKAIVGMATIHFFYSALKALFPAFKKFINLSVCNRNIHPIDTLLFGPIIEEIICRGCLNNGIYLGQKLLKEISPNCLKGRCFNYITSPSPRMLFVHSVFSWKHDDTAPIIFLLCSNFTLLHETTGDITIPIVAHIVNNLYAFGLKQLVCRS